MASPFTIYKVTILYILNRADFPLSNLQIVNFFTEQEYTYYFRAEEALWDLEDAGLIVSDTTQLETRYQLTDKGRESLTLFGEKIGDGIKNDVSRFFADNQIPFRQDKSVRADYYRTTDQTYAAHCMYLSDDRPILDFTLYVQTKLQAEAVCINWKKQTEDVYSYLMDNLLK